MISPPWWLLSSQASGLHGEASCSSVLPGRGSHIWPRLWPLRPITPRSSRSLPLTSCQNGWERVKSMFPPIGSLQNSWCHVHITSVSPCFCQTGEEPVWPGSPAETLHHFHWWGGLSVWLQEWERERGCTSHQDRVLGPDAGWAKRDTQQQWQITTMLSHAGYYTCALLF